MRWGDGVTLQLAAKAGKVEYAKFLVEDGGDVNDTVIEKEEKDSRNLLRIRFQKLVLMLKQHGAKE